MRKMIKLKSSGEDPDAPQMIDPKSAAAATVQARVLDLADIEAVAVLRLVLERRQRLPDSRASHELAGHLTEAARRPVVLDRPAPGVRTGSGTSVLPLPQRPGPVTDGSLARETLRYLLTEEPGLGPNVSVAIVQAQGPLADLTRAPALDLGVLVVLALPAGLTVERAPDEGWQFRVHQKALNDASLAGVLASLIATLGRPRG
jgi:hypothetical protein